MEGKLSFVTNATLSDGLRLDIFLDGIIKVFKERLDEIVVVVDNRTETGRIKALHHNYIDQTIPLDRVMKKYSSSLVRFIDLDYSQLEQVSSKWFGQGNVNRCQNGTPIFAFIYGIEKCKNELIIRSDCDILFLDRGFIQQTINLSEEWDLIQLPFLNDTRIPFSTRSFFLNRIKMQQVLPFTPYKLDFIRRVHRFINGRSSFLALEQMLEKEIDKGKIQLKELNTQFGYTMHVPTREDFNGIETVLNRFYTGQIPLAQLRNKHDYISSLWNAGS